MRILIDHVSRNSPTHQRFVWPENWPLPRVGEALNLANGETAWVSTVHWFPFDPAAIRQAALQEARDVIERFGLNDVDRDGLLTALDRLINEHSG